MKGLLEFGDDVRVCPFRKDRLCSSHMLGAPEHFDDLLGDEQGELERDSKAASVEQPGWNFPHHGRPKGEIFGVSRHHDQVGIPIGVAHQLLVQL